MLNQCLELGYLEQKLGEVVLAIEACPEDERKRPSLEFLRTLKVLIEKRIRVLLHLLRALLFLSDIVLLEIHFFQYHSCGRPPRSVE